MKNKNKLRIVALLLAVCTLIGSVALMSSCDYGVSSWQSLLGTTTTEGGDVTSTDPGKIDLSHMSISVQTRPATDLTPGTAAWVASECRDSVTEIYTTTASGNGAGSGVFFTHDDTYTYLLTNNHVIENATKITVVDTAGNSYDGTLVGTDWISDIAVVRVQATGLKEATLGDGTTVLAEDVVIIGNPLGTLGGSVTKGIISAQERQITVEGIKMTLIQTDASVSPGNSGGAMFNMYGQLIGIINAKTVSSSAGDNGFAIPITTALGVAEQLLSQGYVSGRPYLGLSFKETGYSVVIGGSYLYADELAAGESIEAGDILVSIDGMAVSSFSDVRGCLAAKNPGDRVELILQRRRSAGWTQSYYETLTVTVTLHEYKPASTGDVQFETEN